MQLLHLVGATTTRFYHDLSLTYHRETVTPSGMAAHVLRVAPDGSLHLRLAGEGGETSVDLGRVSAVAATVDLVVPFMFCPDGMTVWRDLFETIWKVPVVGPSLATTVISTSKWQTKALARVSGVRTPDAVRVTARDAVPEWAGPCIVKPDDEDNSIGLSMVRDPAALPAALEIALTHGDAALVEGYIPGREIRIGVLDVGSDRRVLPVLEYHVTPEHPIRVRADKVDVDDAGTVTKRSWEVPSLRTSCPADVGPASMSELETMALRMHDALGARDYSLFDIRIETGTNRPYLLEACSFWTFAPMSIISRMLEAAGDDLTAATERVFRHAAARDVRTDRAGGRGHRPSISEALR